MIKQKRVNVTMYLSTLFLSEIENGAEYAIAKCNEEFLKRLATIQDDISSFVKDSAEDVFPATSQCDEILALWDVFKEFEEEIRVDLPIIHAMKTICAARERRRA